MNFDGLVGPTHNYAGLSMGNRASMNHAGDVSSPRQAALQGLEKLGEMARLGLIQGVIPPPLRPDPIALQGLGFRRTVSMAEFGAARPDLVATVMSASSMWAANAATVSPSADTTDGRIHFTPANLSSTTHRSFEPPQTTRTLRAMFADSDRFRVHRPLPAASAFADEGAANHGRFAATHGAPGVQLFVYGREHDEPVVGDGYPRRQTRLAGELICRSHGIDPARAVFARQASAAIDAGAFHNDVVAVVNQQVLFCHELAFANRDDLLQSVSSAAANALGAGIPEGGVILLEVPQSAVPLDVAISSYLFNSQLVTLPDNTMTLIAPAEVMEAPEVMVYLTSAVTDPSNPIDSFHAFDLRQSMRNGGGPACLRLRVVMTEQERAAVSGRVLIGAGLGDDRLLDDLGHWVETHYRDELAPDDLADPALEQEVRSALEELTRIIDLPGLYDL